MQLSRTSAPCRASPPCALPMQLAHACHAPPMHPSAMRHAAVSHRCTASSFPAMRASHATRTCLPCTSHAPICHATCSCLAPVHRVQLPRHARRSGRAPLHHLRLVDDHAPPLEACERRWEDLVALGSAHQTLGGEGRGAANVDGDMPSLKARGGERGAADIDGDVPPLEVPQHASGRSCFALRIKFCCIIWVDEALPSSALPPSHTLPAVPSRTPPPTLSAPPCPVHLTVPAPLLSPSPASSTSGISATSRRSTSYVVSTTSAIARSAAPMTRHEAADEPRCRRDMPPPLSRPLVSLSLTVAAPLLTGPCTTDVRCSCPKYSITCSTHGLEFDMRMWRA
eukprot:364936-Chlamydomonas_euryale.AAC.6